MEKELELERDFRQQREKELAKSFADENIKIVKKIDDEKVEREAKIRDLSREVKAEFKQQNKTIEESGSLITQKIEQTALNLEKEMDARFDSQDRIVDNLNNMVKTFQETLKVIRDDL